MRKENKKNIKSTSFILNNKIKSKCVRFYYR